jgi:nucleoside-diphosphate-sugar epimerase
VLSIERGVSGEQIGPTKTKRTRRLTLVRTTVELWLASEHTWRRRVEGARFGRVSDFFGAGVTEGSTLGERVFGNALGGRRADFIGNPELPHTYSYVPDIARGLAILGTDERAVDQVWHLPGPETVTTRRVLELIADEVGHPVKSRSVSKLTLRGLGLFNPVLRSMVEMTYQFDRPFVLDTSRYEATFGETGTPLRHAIANTVAWYRDRSGPSRSDRPISISPILAGRPETDRKEQKP